MDDHIVLEPLNWELRMRPRRRTGLATILFASLLALTFAMSFTAPANGQDASSLSVEQQLADKYAPYMSLKKEKSVCDSNAEQYLPITVDIVLNNPDVTLRNEDGDVVKVAPSAQDMANLPAGYYLDYPGTPRDPKCTYAKWFQKIKGDNPPSTYAHVINDGEGHIVVQYWFFYVFNNFNDTHESDWEMMQITFDANSVEEALQIEPTSVALAQHAGGETSEWGSAKLQMKDGHPVTHSASGSHADYYADDIYLGWGDNGTGFGCDITTPPSHVILLKAILVPDKPDPTGPFAWATFGGRWGEKQPAVFNGPPGPNIHKQWDNPVEWEDGLRDSSLTVPTTKTPGPDPGTVFCTITKYGSWPLIHAQANPRLVGAIVATIVLLLISMFIAGKHYFREATDLYVRHIRILLPIGLLLIPIGIVANFLQYLLINYPPGEEVFEVMNKTPGAKLLAAVFIGGLQHFVGVILVAPAVTLAVERVIHGKPISVSSCYRDSVRFFWPLTRALFRVILYISLLAATVIGLPFAVHRTVRWIFTPQAVVLEGSEPKQARFVSANLVIHRWWRTAFATLFFLLIALAPGPLVGLVLLIVGHQSISFANTVASFVFAVFLPISVIGFTLLYFRLKETERTPAPAPEPAPVLPDGSVAAPG
jgi:hypothetical protein